MIDNRLLRQFLISTVLIIFSFSYVPVYCGPHGVSFDVDSAVAVEQEDMPNPIEMPDQQIIMDALNGNVDGFASLLQELLNARLQEKIRQEAAKRAAHLGVLSVEYRELLQDANRSYEQLAASLRIEQCMDNLCQDIRDLIQDTPGQEALIKSFDTVQAALRNGMFALIALPEQLPGNPYDPSNLVKSFMPQKAPARISPADAQFSPADLIVLRRMLQALSLDAVEKKGLAGCGSRYEMIAEKADTLIAMLMAVEAQNSKELTNLGIAFLEPEFERTITTLNETITIFVNARIQLASDADAQLKEALEFWLAQLKKYRKTLKSFQSLASTATIDLSLVLRTASQAYQVASAFFEADRHKLIAQFKTDGGMQLQLLDGACRVAFLSAVCAQRTGDMASEQLQQYVLADGSLSEFSNPLNEWAYVLPLIVQVVPYAWNPAAFSPRMHFVKRAFLRVAGAYFWHNLMVHKNDVWEWPNASDSMRVAIVTTIREAQYFIDGYLHGVVNKHLDPEMLEEVEKFSMGLIKPELMDLALEIMVPMLFLRRGANIMNKLDLEGLITFRAQDFLIYDRAFYWGLSTHFGRPLTEQDCEDAYRLYPEYKLINYACSNLGRFWFSMLTEQCKSQVFAGAAVVGKTIGHGIVAVSNMVLEDDLFTVIMQLALSEAQDGYEQMRALIASLFQEYSPERSIAIGFLKSKGLLSEQSKDPLKVNYALVATFLGQLTSARIFSHSQNAALLEQYMQYQYNVEKFIDILVQQIKDNVAVCLGGQVGSWFGSLVAYKIIWNYRAPALIPAHA